MTDASTVYSHDMHVDTPTHHFTQDGRTAFYTAAQQGHEDVVELLLEAKADPELKDKVASS